MSLEITAERQAAAREPCGRPQGTTLAHIVRDYHVLGRPPPRIERERGTVRPVKWWADYDPDNDRPVTYWPLLRRPGVPNAPDEHPPVWMTTLYTLVVMALVVAVVGLVAFIVASSV
jgi:hypothetical protein